MTDRILTCVEGLDWPALVPFVRSARIHVPRAKLVMFVRGLSDRTIAALNASGVELHPFDAAFPSGRWRTAIVRSALWWACVKIANSLRYADFKRRLITRAGALLLPRNQARFFHYQAYLEDCTREGDRFVLCDARDLVFQSDPFHHFTSTGILFTEEESGVPLLANTYNALWYKETYGLSAVRSDGMHSVVCAGCIGGDRNSLLQLFRVFIAESVHHPHRYGADQAIINRIRIHRLTPHTLLPNRSSMAWHLYGVSEPEIRISSTGEIVDVSGYLYPIVHMYDRHPHAKAAIDRLWSADAPIQ